MRLLNYRTGTCFLRSKYRVKETSMSTEYFPVKWGMPAYQPAFRSGLINRETPRTEPLRRVVIRGTGNTGRFNPGVDLRGEGAIFHDTC